MEVIVKVISLIQEVEREQQINLGNMRSPESANNLLKRITNLHRKSEEHLYMIALDTKNKVNGVVLISKGTLNSAIVHPREVFKHALMLNASSIIVAHNHPSGETQPSSEDIKITHRLVEVGNLIGIDVLDHLIVTDYEFYSLKENGYM